VSFCTAVNCIDGRVQIPVIHYLQEHHGVLYVDVVSEPAPVRTLAEAADSEAKKSILERVGVSISAHGSKLIAVVAHVDCAGNPVDEEEQRRQLAKSIEYIAGKFTSASVIGLWVDGSWSVSRAGGLGAGGEDA
jgi:hypothetical protein